MDCRAGKRRFISMPALAPRLCRKSIICQLCKSQCVGSDLAFHGLLVEIFLQLSTPGSGSNELSEGSSPMIGNPSNSLSTAA